MKSVITNILYFFFAIVIAKVIGILSFFLLAKFLSPSDYGLWITIVLVTSYAPILCFGTVETLIKRYPFYIGKKDFESAEKLENGVYSSVLLSIILFFVLSGFVIFIWGNVFPYKKIDLVFVFSAAVLSLLSGFNYFRIIAHQDFNYVGTLDTSRSFLTLLFIVTLSIKWKLRGAIIGFLIVECVVFSISQLITIFNYKKLSTYFSRQYFLSLIKEGFPITIIWWCFIINTSIDRIISLSLLGSESTGYYGLGAKIVSTIVIIPVVVGRVLYPKLNEELGKNNENLSQYILQPTYYLSLIIGFILGIVFLGSRLIYSTFFPEYIEGLSSFHIILFSAFFISIVRNGINYLISLNHQIKVVIYIICAVTINICTNLFLIKIGYGINGIALGTTISTIFLSILLWRAVFIELNYKLRSILNESAKFMLPLYLLLSIVVLDYVKIGHFFDTFLFKIIFFVFGYLLMLTLVNEYRGFILHIRNICIRSKYYRAIYKVRKC